jgi:hypothetical protein
VDSFLKESQRYSSLTAGASIALSLYIRWRLSLHHQYHWPGRPWKISHFRTGRSSQRIRLFALRNYPSTAMKKIMPTLTYLMDSDSRTCECQKEKAQSISWYLTLPCVSISYPTFCFRSYLGGYRPDLSPFRTWEACMVC